MCHKVAFTDKSRADVFLVKEINPRVLSNPLVVTANVCNGLRVAVLHQTASPASKLMYQYAPRCPQNTHIQHQYS